MNQEVIIRDLQQWLEKNLDKSLSLDEVAARSGYSKWHLQRMFRHVTGDALGSYIRTRRLSRAASELCFKDQSILDIALQSGFDSQQSFSRAFKRQFSQTPGAFRSRMSNSAQPYRHDACAFGERQYADGPVAGCRVRPEPQPAW
ncbi:helix-turn-helix domain-containing protein [Martelella alba]|uniref:Helix-turn-helix domain-containing protein n=1 Tax=Martelella alba TaxID=2590451 RepID=A0ABY2SJT1_9HYPH|nr:helix-turn-helix domain-containing protein [Martelella alba]TKI03456.1 helix-turn-helix domain-containing protein [Martelella alba]